MKLETPLSPEADKFLGEATREFNAKQQTLYCHWRFSAFNRWHFDQIEGILSLGFEDGAEFEAEGQILGTFSTADGSWEWAWANPHVEPSLARDSQQVREVGERFALSYLVSGLIPIPAEEFVAFLCAIACKATDAVGVFRGQAGELDILFTLRNPRWIRSPEQALAA